VLLMIVGYIIAAPRSWSILKWFKTHSNHQSCLEHLRRTLNTWRLTPHVSRWNIEKVLETALSLIPLYPKPQIPCGCWNRVIQSLPVIPKRHRPGDGPVLFMGFSRGRGKECRITSRGNSSGVQASRGSAGDGKMDGGEPGVGKLWKLGRLSKPLKNNIEYSNIVAHLEVVVIFRCCLYNFI
jgi:hypothetical protein